MSLYQSLVQYGWKHIPSFMELLPAIKNCSEELSLTPVTSHEQLLLSKYSEYPQFFDMEHIVIHPQVNDKVLVEVWGVDFKKLSSEVYNLSEALPKILNTLKQHFGGNNAV